MILNKKYFGIYFFLFLSAPIFSQEIKQVVVDTSKVEQLEEVLISATRTRRQLSSLPLPAQIVSEKEIKSVNSLRLNDIINEQTGLITVPDFGGGEGIQLQGLDSQFTLILIDGVPLVGRSAGTLDLSRVSVGNIKQIEIIKGASSSLYGNEALGGVINIITEDPKNGFEGDVNYRRGTFNTQDIGANLNYKKEKFGVNVFINRFSSDGYDLLENDALNTVEPYKNHTFNTKFTYDFSEKLKLSLSGRYYNQVQDNIASETLKGESKIDEWNTLLKLNYQFNEKWKSYLEFYATRYKAEEFLNDETSETVFSQSDFNQSFIRPEFRTTYKLNKDNTIIAGIGLTNEQLKRTYFSTTPEFNSPYIYAQYDGNITEKLNVILGARFDNHSEYESQFSPKAAIRYELNDKFSIKGSAGYGFKAPDFRQLYFDFTNDAGGGYTVLGYNSVSRRLQELFEQNQLRFSQKELSNGTFEEFTIEEKQTEITRVASLFNGNLKPESSIAYNFGIDYKPIETLKININFFRNDLENEIITRVLKSEHNLDNIPKLIGKTNGQNIFSYFNVAESYTQGVELNSTYKIHQNLKISAGYQLLFAKDKEVEQAFKNGDVFARLSSNSPSFRLKERDYFGLFNRSRHMANFKVFYTVPKWKLNTNLRGTYRSKYGLFDSNGNTYLDKYDEFVDGYSIWDFAINKTVFENYKLGVGVDNIFDFKDTQNITNIAGRLIYGTININF